MKLVFLKYLGLAVIGIGLCGVVQAKQAGTDKQGQGHGKHMEKLKEELGLTDAQVAKLAPIFQSMHQDRKAIKQDTVLAKEEKHKQMKALHEKYAGQIAAILTPQQQAKWKELRKQHHQEKSGKKTATASAQT